MVLPHQHIQERAVALITALRQGGKSVCHLRCPGNDFPNLVQGGSHMSPVQVAVGNRARTSEGTSGRQVVDILSASFEGI
jgi:hypothetical protein